MIKTASVNTRDLVLNILMEILEEGAYSSQVIHNVLRNYQYITKQERSFITRLSEGTIERRIEIDYVIDLYSKTKSSKMKPVIRNIIRMGVYQILYMDQIPDRAACDEAVKLAVKRGFVNLKGFVNGVLRTIARMKDRIPYPDREQDIQTYLSVRYSLPLWLVKMWVGQYGSSVTEAMGKAAMESRPTDIWCNGERIEKRQLVRALTQAGIETEESIYNTIALRISGYDYMERVPGFQEGWFQVQDESSMLAVEAAGIGENNYVIDLCAAPGGKSLYAAVKMNGSGKVSARDVSEHKTSLIRENAERLCIENIEILVQDGREILKADKEKADVVLADLPCSGLGVIGKKSDIKYQLSEESLQSLVLLQRELLTAAASYVRPGGILLYSTCTVNKHENEENMEWFQKTRNDFKADSLDPYLPVELHNEQTASGYLQIFPGISEMDGFFMARFKRTK